MLAGGGLAPGDPGAAVIVTRAELAAGVVRQCAAAGVRNVWLHRSFGAGSVSVEAVDEARRLGVHCIAAGCPMMYGERIDFAHRCFRAILGWGGKLPR